MASSRSATDMPLRAARVRSGLSQSEVVARMREVSSSPLPDELLAQYKRWESGRNRPSPFYAELLRLVFPDDDVESETHPTSPDADSDLRRAREARGWTSSRLNYELHRLARARQVAIASPASLRVMISQWENGAQLPDARYRELLNAVLDIPVYTHTSVSPAEADEPAELVQALLSVLRSGASLVIGIAPSTALSSAVQRQAGLDTPAITLATVPALPAAG